VELGRIDVIGTTPLPGLGTPLANVPANVQVFTSRALSGQRARSLPDFLEQNATGLTVNAAQGNPFQPDVSYRGFAASPLLGLPQGLAVFLDGVRVNEPFGDIVNWDLIPRSAIASVHLVPGAQPAFGPNTLGGALALYTKSGSQFPGGELEAYGGSFGRHAAQLTQGGSRGPWDYFVTGHALRDSGWAEHNASCVGQGFAKVGYQTEVTDLDVSFTAANNTLHATQTLPRSFLEDIRQPYTYPDRNLNRAQLVTLKGSQFVSRSAVLGATAYLRKYRSDALASNVEAQPELEATNDRSVIDQTSYGVGAQLTLTGQPWGMENRFIAGTSADAGNARFTRFSQTARFDASRGTVPLCDFEPGTDADSRNRQYGVFVSNALSIDPRWTATVSARYDVTRIRIMDRSGEEPELNGSHRFSRVNPAAGINFNPAPGLTAYVAYGQGMRAPTPIELTCADPGAPCKLPNNFLTDPPLAPVRSTTIETGARGSAGDAMTWSVAVFRTELEDDIQFVGSTGATGNAGYFHNVGRTRRQGVEAAATQRWGALQLAVRYARLDATFRSAFAAASPNNSSADARGIIDVFPGNRIPGVPRDTLKLRVEYAVEAASIGINLLCASAAHARGDENNRDANGKVPGYAVVNLNASWRVWRGLEVFALIDNAFDVRYANFGVLGRNFFTGPGRTFAPDAPVAEQFRGPGAPRGAWLGLRYSWT
jgi:outer membrane receptor protein involved in Fe transport